MKVKFRCCDCWSASRACTGPSLQTVHAGNTVCQQVVMLTWVTGHLKVQQQEELHVHCLPIYNTVENCLRGFTGTKGGRKHNHVLVQV